MYKRCLLLHLNLYVMVQCHAESLQDSASRAGISCHGDYSSKLPGSARGLREVEARCARLGQLNHMISWWSTLATVTSPAFAIARLQIATRTYNQKYLQLLTKIGFAPDATSTGCKLVADGAGRSLEQVWEDREWCAALVDFLS